MKLKDKITIVTGAASGIGRAIAVRFAREGAVVVIADVDEGGAQGTLSQMSGEGVFIKTDVRSEADVKRLVEQAVEKYGSLDVVVNAVGIYPKEGEAAGIDEETYTNLIDTNFKSVFLVSKHTLPHLTQTKGNIINISSSLGIVPEPNSPLYCASKAAINMFTQSTAFKYAPRGVRVNAVCPGPIDTPLLQKAFPTKEEMAEYLAEVPMCRAGTPEEAANVVLFLASSEASYVTGGLYTVDGGEILR